MNADNVASHWLSPCIETIQNIKFTPSSIDELPQN